MKTDDTIDLKLAYEIERLRTVLRTYIHESLRPDCRPDFKFRVSLPNGDFGYAGTREEAERLVGIFAREEPQ